MTMMQKHSSLSNPIKSTEKTANNNPFMSVFSYISTFLVILLVYSHLGVLYGVILLEIISFIFVWSSQIETGECIQISSHNKESLLAYLIPSLFSYVCALVSLYLAGQLWPRGNVLEPQNLFINSNFYFVLMTISLTIKLGLFPFFVYTLNVSQGISWSAIFFLGITSKLPILIILINYGNIVLPEIMIISGILSLLTSAIIIFNSIYVKRYIACSSLASMGWLSCSIGVYKANSFAWFQFVPLSMTLFAFLIVYGVCTILVVIMLEHCYCLFLSSYKGEIEHSLKGKLLSEPRSWLRRFGVIAIFTQMGLPPLIFFFIKLGLLGTMVELGQSLVIFIMVLNSVVMSAAYIWLVWNVSRERILTNTSPYWCMKEEETLRRFAINNRLEGEETRQIKLKLEEFLLSKNKLTFLKPFFYNHFNHKINGITLMVSMLMLLLTSPLGLSVWGLPSGSFLEEGIAYWYEVITYHLIYVWERLIRKWSFYG